MRGQPPQQPMGRWSRLVAPLLVDFAAVPETGRALDVGSGTGVLALGGDEAGATTPYNNILGGDNSRFTGKIYVLGLTTRLGTNAATAANNAPNALPANAILQFGSIMTFSSTATV